MSDRRPDGTDPYWDEHNDGGVDDDATAVLQNAPAGLAEFAAQTPAGEDMMAPTARMPEIKLPQPAAAAPAPAPKKIKVVKARGGPGGGGGSGGGSGGAGGGEAGGGGEMPQLPVKLEDGERVLYYHRPHDLGIDKTVALMLGLITAPFLIGLILLYFVFTWEQRRSRTVLVTTKRLVLREKNGTLIEIELAKAFNLFPVRTAKMVLRAAKWGVQAVERGERAEDPKLQARAWLNCPTIFVIDEDTKGILLPCTENRARLLGPLLARCIQAGSADDEPDWTPPKGAAAKTPEQIAAGRKGLLTGVFAVVAVMGVVGSLFGFGGLAGRVFRVGHLIILALAGGMMVGGVAALLKTRGAKMGLLAAGVGGVLAFLLIGTVVSVSVSIVKRRSSTARIAQHAKEREEGRQRLNKRMAERAAKAKAARETAATASIDDSFVKRISERLAEEGFKVVEVKKDDWNKAPEFNLKADRVSGRGGVRVSVIDFHQDVEGDKPVLFYVADDHAVSIHYTGRSGGPLGPLSKLRGKLKGKRLLPFAKAKKAVARAGWKVDSGYSDPGKVIGAHAHHMVMADRRKKSATVHVLDFVDSLAGKTKYAVGTKDERVVEVRLIGGKVTEAKALLTRLLR